MSPCVEARTAWELYVKDIPIGPPTVSTVGDEKLRLALPLAMLTVTGLAESKGEGPVAPKRMSILNFFTHGD